MQRHKAEEDIAVAAASILARDEFVKGLAKLEQQFEMKFPKGASAAVDAAAKQFVEERGAEDLAKFAKLHFRTALRAQGLPEPPKDGVAANKLIFSKIRRAQTQFHRTARLRADYHFV